MSLTVKTLYVWLVLGVITTLICGLVYIVAQQDLRQGANDPQIQIAQDVAAKLSAGATVDSMVSKEVVDISKSLSPFITVTDEKGQTVASTAVLHGVVPKLPAGVFDYVKTHGEDRITWQPETGVRQAAVITSYEGVGGKGFVAVGRSLTEVEKRESQVWQEVLVVWIITLAATLVLLLLGSAATKRQKTHHVSNHENLHHA